MITKNRDLRTGHPVWEALPAPRVPRRDLHRDIDTDVLIVGAGITGAMTAETLADAGLSVVVVDKRGPMKGATAASTALVQYEIDTPLIELSRKIGRIDAIRAWRRSRLAVTALSARIRQLTIPQAERRDALYLAGNRLNAGELKREAKARRDAGLETLYLTRAQLKQRFGISRPAALLGYDNIAVNPRALTGALLNAAEKNGARIFTPVEIADVDSRKRNVVATTSDGHSITCKSLVFATGYEMPKYVPAKGHKITSTWAIATVPQKSRLWPEQCLIWEASDPYLYLRTTEDGRIVCGGEDEEFSDEEARDRMIARKVAILRRKLKKLLPGIDATVDFSWAASFGESSTGLPTIGPVPRLKNCWATLGYGGNGITYSRIAAEILRTALTGGEDPDADLYAFKS